jgi:hypothetical protein
MQDLGKHRAEDPPPGVHHVNAIVARHDAEASAPQNHTRPGPSAASIRAPGAQTKWEAGGKINDAHHRLLLLVMKMSAPALAKHERFKQLMRPLHSGGDPALAFLFLIGVIQ